MATTTNFGWETPDDTDLVKDGAAAMRTLGNSIDTSFVDLKGGTTGQILAKASNTDLDYTWITNDVGDITEVAAGTGISGGGTSGAVTITNSMATAIDAKGDLVVGTGADAFTRLAIGSNNQVLTADSTAATGMKWATPAAGGYTLISTTTLSGATTTLSSIPGTYRDLVLIIKQITNGSSYVPRFTVNNNTTDQYHWTRGGFGTGSASWGTDYQAATGWDLTNQGTNQDGAASTNYHHIYLPDYANTTSPKIMRSQSYGISTLGGSPYSNFVVGYFATTTGPTIAISSIEIKVSAGSATGGTALLYGVS